MFLIAEKCFKHSLRDESFACCSRDQSRSGEGTGHEGWLVTPCHQQLPHSSAALEGKSPEEDSLVEAGRGEEMYLWHVLFYLVLNMNKQ